MDILNLLETKNFEDLNTAEVNFVCQQMSADEYKQQREIIVMTQGLFAEDISQPTIVPLPPNKALAALKNKKKSGILLLFQSKISLWKAAAVFVALLGTYHYFIQNSSTTKAPVYITEYVEKEVVVPADPDTVIKEVVVEVQKEKLASTETSSQPYKVGELHQISPLRLNIEEMAMLNNLEAEILEMKQKDGVRVSEDSITRKVLGI
ncbi:hypothetical protein SAMN05216474_2749 [Lishizhenia tianjinensis]|uniref:Uncharacterized protein n=1 Tax=Lishizhenia tianjinensis TaxID=477690 RepID=A0A1I7BER3_9FLAO|nr:hypothetical protein [Lishizhenia tianjinensis]SFT85645.1 hypothetical protein SAMN05216474_2749 [Lishizhenia tianjinensis]